MSMSKLEVFQRDQLGEINHRTPAFVKEGLEQVFPEFAWMVEKTTAMSRGKLLHKGALSRH